MSEKVLPTPSPSFLAITSPLKLDDAEEWVQSRWAAVVDSVKEARLQAIQSWVEVLYAESDSRYEKAARSFGEIGAELERAPRDLKTMSCAALAHLLEGDETRSKKRVCTALAITTTGVGGQRKVQVPVDLERVALGVLRDSGVLARERGPLPPVAAKAKLPLSLTQLSQQFADASSPDSRDFTAVLQNLGSTIATFVQQANAGMVNSLSQALHQLAIQDEELQVLWWLIARQSTTASKSFDQLSDAEKPIVLASELAGFAADRAELPGFAGILARAGVDDNKEFSIPNCVDACDLDWLRTQKFGGRSVSPILTPIYDAMQRRLEFDGNPAWPGGWKGATGLDPDATLQTTQIALQFYRECQLVSVAKGLDR